MLDGDLATGRVLLRDFINATIGFPALAAQLDVTDKSLTRMLGPNGNPHMENLVAIFQAVKSECRLALTVAATSVRHRKRDDARVNGEAVVVRRAAA